MNLLEESKRHYMTVPEAAKRVKRSVRTIERWISSGQLSVVWFENVRYVRQDLLLAVYRQHHRRSPTAVERRLTEKYLR